MMRHALWVACVVGVFPVFSQTVISPGANVQTAIDNAAPNSTLWLNAGTYNLPAGLVINKAITIASNTPGQRPVLQAPNGTTVGVDIKASNVRLDSLRIANAMWGIYAGDGTNPTPYSNITIKNVAINAVPGINSGHGIFFINVLNPTIDSNVIEAAPVSGIIVQAGSANATIINNVVNCGSGNGITVQFSASPIVAGNTIVTAGQFGILVQGARFAQVERNTIGTGVKHDGIVISSDTPNNTFTDSAYVGRNDVNSGGRAASLADGTGIWLNNESNGVLVYGNTTSGAPENGLTIFNSSNSWFWGNVTSANGHGGIYIFGPTNLPYSIGPAPANNFVQGNYVFGLPVNGGVNLDLSSNSTVFNNMLKSNPVGIMLQRTSGNRVFQNLSHNNSEGVHAYPGATGNSAYFLNRHLSGMANYAEPGSSVTLDAGAVLGGNFQPGGKVLTDAYPYSAETLGRAPSVNVTLPLAGTVAGAGTRKTIEWRSTACTYVDLYYKKGGAAQQLIVADYPDVGVYQWTVPAATAGSDYTVVVDCNNSAGNSLGVSGSSGAFTIAPSGVELLSPQGNNRVTAGAQTRVTWARSAGTTGAVTVQYRSTVNGGLTTLASNVTDNQALVTVPAGGTGTGMFVITVAGSSVADSSDGFVNVAGTTPAVTGPSGAVGIGTLQLVQWSTHTNSRYVDIEYSDGGTYQTVVTNLPDFGRFYFLVPGKAMTNTHLRVRFKDSSLAAITTANSGGFNTVVAETPGGGGGNAATPDAVSISPTSGTGAGQAFSVTYSDANGATDIGLAYFMVNTVVDGANSCFIEYNRATNTFRLMNDAGTTWSGNISAGSGTLSNSRCTLNGAGSSASPSGNNLAVTFNMTFAGAQETRNTYALAIDAGSANSGWKTLGTWTVSISQPPPPPPPTSRPDVISLTPADGSGASGTFTATYRHPGGREKHYLGYMLFLPLPNIVSFNAQGTCLIEYNRISNGMRLIDNAGTGWLGPLEGVKVTPTTAPLSNNACTVSVAGTVVTFAGTDMIVRVPVTFKAPGVTARMGTFLQEQDVNGQWTDFRQFGNWSMPGAGSKPGSFVASAPTSGAGSTLNLTAVVGHTSGAAKVGQMHILFSDKIVGGTSCHAVYFPGSNTVALVNDAGTGIIGPVPLGTPLSMSRCSLGAGGSRIIAGTIVSVTLPLTFNPATVGGVKNVYVNGFDVDGGVTHWVQTGTFTIQ